MTNFKKLLLAGTAVVAIGAVATTATTSAFAASEFVVDTDDDGTFEPGADDAAAADNGQAVDANITVNDDLQYRPSAAGDADILVIDGTGFTIGNEAAAATNAAISLGTNLTGSTLTINSDPAADVTLTIEGTADGAISRNGNAAFNVTFAGNTGNNNQLTVDVNGMVDLGTGTLTLDAAAAAREVGVMFDGNVTAGSIVLDHDTAVTDAVIAFDGSTAQTVTGAITGAADGEGTVIVANTTGQTVTFASAVGTAANTVGVLQIGGAANTIAGSALGGGSAIFSGAVDIGTINIGAGSTDDESATGDFNGDVVAADINILGDTTAAAAISSATFAGDVAANIDLDDGAANATVTFDGTTAQTVSGGIEGVATQDGQVFVGAVGGASNVTFTTDNIGTSNADGIELFNVRSGSTATSTGIDIFTDSAAGGTAGLVVGGTLNLNSTAAAITVDEVTGDMDFNGTLSLTGTNAVGFDAASDVFIDGTFSTALVGAETTITTGADTGFANSANTTVNLSNPLNIAATGEVKVGDGTPAAGGDGFNTTINVIRTASFDPTAVDVIDQTGEFNFDGDGVVTFTIGSTTSEFDTGDTITLVDGDTAPDLNGGASTFGALITSGDVVLQDTAFLNLESNAAVTDVGAGDLGVTVTVNSAANVLAGNSFDNFADTVVTTITSATTTAGGTLETFRGAVQGATTANVQRVVESGAPTVDGAAQTGVVSTVTNSALGLTGDRLASLRDGEAATGMAAGNMTHGLKVWGQVFGSTGEQDTRDGVSGYDVDGYGVTVGIDTQTLAEDWVWGLAFTYADTEVDSENLANTNIELDTYQIALYGDYKWDAATYINGQVGYAMNSGDQTKTNAGGAGLTANADVDSDVFFARLEAGRDYDMDNGWTLTPITMLNFQHIDSDGYTETGTCGALCLTNVSVDDIQVLEAGLGAEASYLHQNADGSFLKPKLHAAYRYDFIGDEVETTGSFADPLATATFTATGADAQQSTFNVGAGLSFYTTSNWELSANYDYEIKEDYDAHNGYVKAAYKF